MTNAGTDSTFTAAERNQHLEAITWAVEDGMDESIIEKIAEKAFFYGATVEQVNNAKKGWF